MSYQALAARQSPRFNLVVIDGSYQGARLVDKKKSAVWLVLFLKMVSEETSQEPSTFKFPALPIHWVWSRFLNSKQHFQQYHLYYVYFMHFPPSSHSPLVIWPHLNESKKIKGPDYIQSSCHGLWEGRIANTSVQMVQPLLPPFTPAVVLHVLTFPCYVVHTGGPWRSSARSWIYSSSQTPPPFTSELTLSMQITLIQNS